MEMAIELYVWIKFKLFSSKASMLICLSLSRFGCDEAWVAHALRLIVSISYWSNWINVATVYNLSLYWGQTNQIHLLLLFLFSIRGSCALKCELFNVIWASQWNTSRFEIIQMNFFFYSLLNSPSVCPPLASIWFFFSSLLSPALWPFNTLWNGINTRRHHVN